ncbi:hypothetical protein [Streptomyces sp. NPDC091371]|uniref:hypothetical protein n=1 Tax=Streptomyces sp. NPDC091371 TaxID=3155303 RepID=UPI00341BEE7E
MTTSAPSAARPPAARAPYRQALAAAAAQGPARPGARGLAPAFGKGRGGGQNPLAAAPPARIRTAPVTRAEPARRITRTTITTRTAEETYQ